jgi:uncharacterized RDD family membrane protein YckC
MYSFTFLYASVWRRALASLIDLAIIALVSVFLLDPFISFLGLKEASETIHRLPLSVIIVRTYGAWAVLTLIAAWLYHAWQESSRFQATIGKRLLSLQIFTEDEGRLTFREASERFWLKLFSGAIGCVGFLLAFFDADRRTLHDRISHTEVLQPSSDALSNFYKTSDPQQST